MEERLLHLKEGTLFVQESINVLFFKGVGGSLISKVAAQLGDRDVDSCKRDE